MHRLMRSLVVAALAASSLLTTAHAQEAPVYQWSGGFGDISNAFAMGQPIEAPHMDDDGNVIVQRSSNGGTAYFLVVQNQPSFLEQDGFTRHARTADNRFVNWFGDVAVAPDSDDWQPEFFPKETPRQYLHWNYPEYEAVISCLAQNESAWSATYVTPRSMLISGQEVHAKGLLQFIDATWAGTPQGKLGASIFNPYAQIDSTVWALDRGHGAWWETWPLCH